MVNRFEAVVTSRSFQRKTFYFRIVYCAFRFHSVGIFVANIEYLTQCMQGIGRAPVQIQIHISEILECTIFVGYDGAIKHFAGGQPDIQVLKYIK